MFTEVIGKAPIDFNDAGSVSYPLSTQNLHFMTNCDKFDAHKSGI